MTNTRKRGSGYEQVAADFLMKQGYEILEMNYRIRQGEIDIIARKRGYLAFVEVKLRRSDRFAEAREYVDRFKQDRLRCAASLWLAENETTLQPRFDVIEVYGETGAAYDSLKIRHYENAFE